MKKTLLLTMIFASQFGFSQENEKSETQEKSETEASYKTDPMCISIESDVNFLSSTKDARKESTAGTGTLGLNFKSHLLYGSIHFTVFSKSDSIVVNDSSEVKSFGTNLLIPQNSNGSLSNFNFEVGSYHIIRALNDFRKDDVKKTFANKMMNDNFLKHFDNLGVYFNLNVNNNTWKFDSIITPVSIVSANYGLQYLVWHTESKDSTKQIAKIIVTAGKTFRGLGGDYGLNNFIDKRSLFLNTESLAFRGVNLGVKLELGNFFGKIDYTIFNKDNDISGFSGNQFVISLGLKASLNIPVNKVID